MAQLVDDLQTSGELVTIAVVGKYTGLSDSYLSVIKVTCCCLYFSSDYVLT